MSERLDELRARIDAVDERLLELFNERARLAQAVGEAKRAQGEGDDGFYRPDREAQILRRVQERNPGPLSGETVARLFRELMSACLALEQPLEVAFLGPEGTFTQAAAIKHFGHAVRTVPVGAIDEVFREVEAGAAHYGVVPVENSTEGVVTHTLDRFMVSPLKICGEVVLRIHHQLLSRAPDLGVVRRVYAHQQALAQCREWLTAHLAGVERVSVASNAEAARLAAEDAQAAAIASEAAAEIYGLDILVANIEDEPDNTTRFLVIGTRDAGPTGGDKTALMLSTQNRPGALYRLLAPLDRLGVSMTRIESRPSRRAPWDYVFFIDIEGHREDPPVAEALRELEAEAAMVRVLGSFPKAVL